MNRKEALKKWEEIIQDIENKKPEIDRLFKILKEANIEQTIAGISQKETEANSKSELIGQLYQKSEEKIKEIDNIKIKTEELLNTNNEQAEKISDLLQKAAAGTLFEAFKIRKTEHEKSASFWVKMIGVAIIALLVIAGWIVWVVHIKNVLSYEFLVKLSISIPLIFWLSFSTKQYTKSKKLEEEYAFKSSISLSLEAYRDLLKRESGEPTKAEVVPFITSAVDKIFSSPNENLAQHSIKEDKDIVDSFSGLIEKIARLIGK
ncbi:MAG: hypothetical protein UT31_C0001G0004 [Parcubacteria group bacterium GW2011_GWF2_39_13b]|nr:MAG: hypothetical protein UT31_C0001G0004 [Parcubacteria group bacterium GW2011_GWF2_39_13b]